MWIFLASLFIIILTHELSHLIVAKICKCGVSIFSIGFGKPIFKKKIGKTTYQIAWMLLGGYCQLQSELKFSRSKYAFTNLKYLKKVMISLAGVFTNIILGILSCYIALRMNLYYLFYFGYLSIILGISNMLPIPALDGSYPLMVLLEKKLGKKKSYELNNKIIKISLRILIIFNIICLPWFILVGIKLLSMQTKLFYYILGGL